MKLIIMSAITIAAVMSNGECNKKKECKGPAKEDCVCIQIYKPVCGCDGKTYGNDCVAACEGVKSWKEGECPK